MFLYTWFPLRVVFFWFCLLQLRDLQFRPCRSLNHLQFPTRAFFRSSRNTPCQDVPRDTPSPLLKGPRHAICYLFKKLKHFLHWLNYKNNGPVLLFRTIFYTALKLFPVFCCKGWQGLASTVPRRSFGLSCNPPYHRAGKHDEPLRTSAWEARQCY